MSCTTIFGVLSDPSVTGEFCGMANVIPNVIKGEDITLSISLVKGDGPFPLSGVTGASGYFLNDDTTTLIKAATVVSADLGSLTIQIPNEESSLLKAGDELDFEIVVDKGAARTIVQQGLTWNVQASRFVIA